MEAVTTQIALVRFDCGCVGTTPLSGHSLLIDACDDTDIEPMLALRDVSEKTFEPVDPERQKRLLAGLHNALADARRYRDLKSNLLNLLEKP